MSNLTAIKNVMLISPTKVKSFGIVGINLDDARLGECIRLAHIHVREVVTPDLMLRLQELVFNKIQGLPDTIDDAENEAYKALLDECVVPALAYATGVEAAVLNHLKIRNAGTVKNTDSNVITTGPDEYKYLAEYLRGYLNDAYNRIAEFLCENKEAFVELPAGYCTCSSRPRYASTGLWLGK